MKKIFFFALIVLMYFDGLTQQKFYYSINTKIYNTALLNKLYINYEIDGIKYTDSIIVVKSISSYKKQLAQPVAATISTNNLKIEPITLLLANNNVQIEITDTIIVLNKSKLQKDFMYLTANDRIRPNYFPLYGELYAKNDTIGLNKLSVIFDSLKKDDIYKAKKYFKKNTTSLLSLFVFNRYTTFFGEYAKVEKDYALLPNWAKKSPDGLSILAKIKGAKSANINTKAKDFTQNSIEEKPIRLADYQGKYVLLDFWASWCAPCRKEHPNLINIYNTFKEKEFTIISVSLDDNIEDWRNAIKNDQITWIQISDLKGQQNKVAILYGVQSVPANFLIDPNGIIIAKNLSSGDLLSKLKELLEK